MIILPAIDLYSSKAVRLYKGDYSAMTVYNDDPLETAKDFEASGAEYIHIVDLEGAKSGETPNIATVERIVNGTSLFAEIGGGIRSMETIEKYISIGVKRVILGTAAVVDRQFLIDAVNKYSDRIAVGVDIRDILPLQERGIDLERYPCRQLLGALNGAGFGQREAVQLFVVLADYPVAQLFVHLLSPF